MTRGLNVTWRDTADDLVVAGGTVAGIRVAQTGDDAVLLAPEALTWSPRVTPGPPLGPEASFFGERLHPEEVLVAQVGGQGRGVGRRLVAAGQQRAGRRGVRKLTLRVLALSARGTRP